MKLFENGKLHKLAAVAAALVMTLSLASCQSPPPVPQQDESLSDIEFTAEFKGGESQDITFWGDGERIYYYFLPSCSGPDKVRVSTKNGITLRLEGESENSRRTFYDGDELDDIECGPVYLLGCYDKNSYLYEVPVVFLQGENIHSVFITSESGSFQNVFDDKDYKEKGSMVIADPKGKVVYEGELSHIKGRGNGSWYSFKKPFNIKLKKSADLLGMGDSREWCLINQETDNSLIRNKLAYDMAKDAGLKYSPDSEFVDLWLDGQYYGLFLLTDRINISEASVDITDLEKATEAVNLEELKNYPLTEVTAERSKNEYQYSDIPSDPADITGGYLIEVDKFYAQDKAARFNTDRVFSVTLKSPEYATKKQIEYIRSFVREAENAIADTGSGDYKKYINTESWVKMCVLQELLANSDYMGSSQYFYKDVDKEGKRSLLYAGPVWDMDISLGSETNTVAPNVFLTLSRSWFGYLIQHEDFYDEVKDSYSKVYRPLAQKLIDSGIDGYADKIRASTEMNFTRWPMVVPEGSEKPMDEAKEKLKDYLSKRIDFLDGFLLGSEKYRDVKVTTDTKLQQYSDLYYWFDYMVIDGEPLGELKAPEYDGYTFKGWYYGTPNAPGAPYDPDAPVTRDMKVCAIYTKTQ